MQPSPAKWPSMALRALVPALGFLLVVQYLLGLWTNAYAPSAGFTSNSDSPSLDWHYNVGFILGILSIVTFVIALVGRRLIAIGLAGVAMVSIIAAGLAGGRYVSSTPNDPTATLAMGLFFLIAFWATMMMGIFLNFDRFRSMMPTASPPASTP